MNEYFLVNIDDDAYPYYYGFINCEGEWYIMKQFADGSVLYSVHGNRGPYDWENRVVYAYIYWDKQTNT